MPVSTQGRPLVYGASRRARVARTARGSGPAAAPYAATAPTPSSATLNFGDADNIGGLTNEQLLQLMAVTHYSASELQTTFNANPGVLDPTAPPWTRYAQRTHPVSTTVAQSLQHLADMDPDSRAALQSKLWGAGYYGGRVPLWGEVDGLTVTAFKKLIDEAIMVSAGGGDMQTFLDRKILANQSQPGRGKGPVFLEGKDYTINTSDPNEVRLLADKVGQAVLGRKLTKAEHAKALAQVTGTQTAQQQKIIAADKATRLANAQLRADVVTDPTTGEVLPAGEAQLGGAPSGARAVSDAMRYIGIPYVYGAGHGAEMTPGRPAALDCSSFVGKVYGDMGINIAGTTVTQVRQGQPVASLDQAMPGDLVFFGDASSPSHVGLYIGGGKMIAAPHTGDHVRVQPVYENPSAIRRVVDGASAPLGGRQLLSAPDTLTSVQDVNPTADVETMLREQNPVEAGAHDMSAAFLLFSDLLRGV